MNATDADITDDGRRWWFVSAETWSSSGLPVAAPHARAALAEVRRDMVAAEVANGWSRRAATEYVRAIGLAVVDGPLTTPEAYEREFGWALAWAACRWTADVPRGPATPENCKPRLSDDQIERLRVEVRAHFVARSEQTGSPA